MTRPRRHYTHEQRADALALYATNGPTCVQRELGIPKGTVTQWAKKAGVETVRNEQTAAATEAARVDWEQRRMTLAHEIGEAASEALTLTRLSLAAAACRDAQASATTMAILVDKAQLLTGAATGRTEVVTVDQIDREIERLTAELVEPVHGPT